MIARRGAVSGAPRAPSARLLAVRGWTIRFDRAVDRGSARHFRLDGMLATDSDRRPAPRFAAALVAAAASVARP
jgi:hypothetical protein